jgi:ABC-2 type transport system permease protein
MSNHYSGAFWAMVHRDLLAQWRDKGEFIFRVVMLPLILIITYGYVLPEIGLVPDTFPTHMFAGMIGMSILITGIHGTAIPFTMDFNNMHEIEDRLQAPVPSNLVAYAKMLVGIIEAFIGGLLVLPFSAFFMGDKVNLVIQSGRIEWLVPVLILIAIASATMGLLVGTIVKPMQIAAMFPGFLMPMVFSGAIFFTWNSLGAVPIFQKIILINPLVYANEALRYALTPQIDSMPIVCSIAGLVISSLIMGYFGFKRFHHMCVNR